VSAAQGGLFDPPRSDRDAISSRFAEFFLDPRRRGSRHPREDVMPVGI
jgi:hypothetical protein